MTATTEFWTLYQYKWNGGNPAWFPMYHRYFPTVRTGHTLNVDKDRYRVVWTDTSTNTAGIRPMARTTIDVAGYEQD